MKKMVGLSFGEVKLTRKDRVKPLATVHRGAVIREDIVPVNPQQLFMRIVCVMKTEENLHEYLRFELAPTPPALFDDVSLRKTAKSVVQSFFPSDPPQELDCEGACKVVDGGYLLHVVVWPRPATYGQVIQCYVKYIQNRFGSAVTVVFDGYDISSTKTQEQRRRATKRAPAEVVFDENTSVTLTQADFLSHPMNKARLIDLLSDEFQKVGVGVKRAAADADTLIVTTALQLDESGRRTTLVASDTDILVMLIARAKDDTSIKMLIPNSSTTPGKVFTIADIRSQNKSMNDCVLFWHAVTGCDTTSALYRMGKKRAWKLLKDRPGLKTCSDIFKNPNASKEEISAAGEKFIVALYNGEEGESLDSLRVIRYTQTIAKQPVTGSFDLATLPPTSAACEQHSYRTYLQVQEWLETSKDPENWGWKSYRSVLVPIPSSRPPAPDSLLNLISCGCKTDCAVRCSCRQAGLKCGIVCSYCRGGSCTNSDFIDDEDVDNPEVLSEI